jgi:hypothetical protein
MAAVEVQRIRAADLCLITEVEVDGERLVLQRRESDSRLQHLRDAWDDALVGVLTVHRLIDHPTMPGIKHPGDGGSRLLAKTDEDLEGHADPDYEFLCSVEDVTIRESARRFLGLNKDRKAVAKLDEYGVALTAQEPWAVAVRNGLAPLNLTIARFPHYGNGQGGKVAAVAGCEEAVKRAQALFGDWIAAAEHLTSLLTITRRAFVPVTVTDRDESSYAHDGDLIRAMSRIMLREKNPEKLAREDNRSRMAEKLGSRTPAWWKSKSTEMSTNRAATPGSGGRPQYLAALIVYEFNKGLRTEERRLANPSRIVIE